MASRLASSDASSFAATVPTLGSPSWHLVVMRVPSGRTPWKAARDDRFARAVHRGGVDEVDAGRDGFVDGGDGFLFGRCAPSLPETTSTERQATDVRTVRAEEVCIARLVPRLRAIDQGHGPARPALPFLTHTSGSCDSSPGDRVQLAWGPEDEAFRAELIAFLDAHTPDEARRRLRLPGRRRRRPRARPAVDARLAGDALRPRLDDPRLPARARRPELHAGADADLPRDAGEPAHPAVGPLPRLRDRRAEPARVRQRRAEARWRRPRSAATRSGASA